MTIAARVQNHTITLPAQMDIQDGIEVQVTLPDQPARETPASFFNSIRGLIGAAQGLQEDFAAEHDHYIPTPKAAHKWHNRGDHFAFGLRQYCSAYIAANGEVLEC